MMADSNNNNNCRNLSRQGDASETSGHDATQTPSNEHQQPRGYHVLGEIGRGAFGVVYRAVDLTDQKLVAIKEKGSQAEGTGSDELIKEADILKRLSHPNIVNLIEICGSVSRVNASDSPALVLEYGYCDFVELFETHWEKLEVQHLKSLSQQLLTGLKYIHSQNVIHRDVKPENIMLTDDGTVKITDFGLARYKSKNRTGSGKCFSPHIGTRIFKSPELLLGTTKYSSAVDMWAAGLTVFELFTGSFLFPVKDTNEEMLEEMVQVLGTIDSSTMSQRLDLPDLDLYNLPKNKGNQLDAKLAMNLGCKAAIKLLSGLLRLNPDTRFSATSALAQHFFRCEPLPEKFIIKNMPGYPTSPPHPPPPPTSSGHTSPPLAIDYLGASSPGPVPDSRNGVSAHQTSPRVGAGPSVLVEQIRPAPELALPSTAFDSIVSAGEINMASSSNQSPEELQNIPTGPQSAISVIENTRRNRRRQRRCPRAQPLREANGRFHPYFSPN